MNADVAHSYPPRSSPTRTWPTGTSDEIDPTGADQLGMGGAEKSTISLVFVTGDGRRGRCCADG